MADAKGALQIVQAADFGGPYAGSFVPTLCALADAARAEGHTMRAIFTPVARERGWLGDLREAGVPVTFAASKRFGDLSRALADAVGAPGPAVLHTHFTAFDLPALRVARRRPSTRVVWHLHTRLSSRPHIRAANSAKFAIAGRRADRILAVSDHLADAARARLAPGARVGTAPNAVDLRRYPPRTPERIRAAREALGLGNAPTVVHFGRDWELKGGDLLLEAVRILADRGSAVHVVTIAGADAMAHAAELGLADRVRVLEPVADASVLYTAADVFVSSSRAEGMPYSLLEAAATGTGVVATDIPGQAELASWIPGARLAPLAAEPLADAIEAMLSRDPELVGLDALASRAWVAANADVADAARRVIEIYEQVAAA